MGCGGSGGWDGADRGLGDRGGGLVSQRLTRSLIVSGAAERRDAPFRREISFGYA